MNNSKILFIMGIIGIVIFSIFFVFDNFYMILLMLSFFISVIGIHDEKKYVD